MARGKNRAARREDRRERRDERRDDRNENRANRRAERGDRKEIRQVNKTARSRQVNKTSRVEARQDGRTDRKDAKTERVTARQDGRSGRAEIRTAAGGPPGLRVIDNLGNNLIDTAGDLITGISEGLEVEVKPDKDTKSLLYGGMALAGGLLLLTTLRG